MKKILITGAAGFIGHYLVKEFISDYKVVCMIRSTESNLDRLSDVLNDVEIIYHDIKNTCDHLVDSLKDVEVILHAGGNPSSEDSINNPMLVITDNVLGTANLLELARKLPIKRFVYYSAGEIFGPVKDGSDSKENDAYNSISPYAASKASGEELCTAYSHTFKVPTSILHLINTFGQKSQSKRFPVITIKKLLNNEVLDIHTGGDNNSVGGRRWFHAADVALHTRFILDNQQLVTEKWNSAGHDFINNLDFAMMISDILGKKLNYNLVPMQRAGHNPFISIDPYKIYNRGWKPQISTQDRLIDTVKWYEQNKEWLTKG